MKTSPAGIALIKSFEGCRLTAYPDIGYKESLPTIGYGHTGPGVSLNPPTSISQAQADAFLENDLEAFEDQLVDLLKIQVTQYQFDALVDFVYNLGAESLKGSTLLMKLNRGDIQGAAEQFSRWVFSNGQKLPGLVRRRAAEQNMFLGEGLVT